MIGKILALFDKIVSKIENDSTPLSRYFQLFGAILAVRLMLEFYSNHRRWELDDVIHISLWFVFIVLAFLVQLKLFSGEQLARVAKLVVVCFTIALTAPMIDLLVFGGKGVKMNYLSIQSCRDVLWSYLTIGGSSISRGATVGIRVEIALLVVASFNYIRVKTGNWMRAFTGTVCIYTVLFFSGALPTFLNSLSTTFSLSSPPGSKPAVSLLLFLDLLLLGWAALLHLGGERVKRILKTVNWAMCFLGLGAFGLGLAWSLHMNPGRFEWNTTTIFLPALGLLAAGAMVVSYALDHWCVEERFVSKRNALLWFLMIVAFGLGGRLWFLVAVWWGCGFLLHERPLVLNGIPVVGHALRGLRFWVLALQGWTLGGGILVGYPVSALSIQIMGTVFLLMGLDLWSGRSTEWRLFQDAIPEQHSKKIGFVSGLLGLVACGLGCLMVG